MPLGNIIKKLFKGQAEPAVQRLDNGSTRHWISNPWHAVSVVPCRGACGAARQSNGVRYLSKSAPALPLTGCTATACTCRYRHHEDRRRALRRASDVMVTAQWAGRERREARGRRLTDQA
jgi:hypothetical protein